MEEKANEMYQDYLSKRLDIIFSIEKTDFLKLVQVGNMYNFSNGNNGYISDVNFDKAYEFSNGYAKVGKDGKWNLLDTNGKLVSTEWYDDVFLFVNDYAKVKKNEKWNFINKDGKIISEEWFKEVYDFSCGYAAVRCDYYLDSPHHGKGNFIDGNGNVLSKDWEYWQTFPFHDGIALIKTGRSSYFIDTNGKRVTDVYPTACEFHNGYAKVFNSIIGNSAECNFVDKNGNLICNKWYSYADNFNKYGLAKVRESYSFDGPYSIINGKGIKICDNLKEVKEFNNGYALVKTNDEKWNFIDVNGHFMLEKGVEYVYEDEDLYRVRNGSKYNYTGPSVFENNKKFISDKWFSYADNFYNGYAVIKLNNKFNLINREGKFICKEPYSFIWGFNNGFAFVRNGMKYNAVDKDGNLLFNWTHNKPGRYTVYKNFIQSDNGNVFCITRNLDNYEVKKTIKGYKCTKGKEVFYLKYEPIRIYSKNIILCSDGKEIHLYDGNYGSYTDIGTGYNVWFDDNFIYDGIKRIVYFVYNDKKYDITEYYDRNLKGKKFLITPDVSIISREVFINHNINDIKKIVKEEQEQDEKRKEEKKLQEAKENDIRQREELIKKYQSAIEELQELVNLLDEIERKTGEHTFIEVKNLLIDVGDHKEINPMYIKANLLKYIDLSKESFKNVKISGIDFRGCNIILNPKEVYPKEEPDLSNCNFEGIHIPAFLDFTGVDIRGSRFSDDHNPKTVDGQNVYFKEAIYDETTTYNGIPFTMIYGECERLKSKNK